MTTLEKVALAWLAVGAVLCAWMLWRLGGL